MNMILLTGPSLEPVTLAEMKLWLKIDGSEDDNVINALIVSARLSVEACLLYTSPSPRDGLLSRMPSSA